MYLENARLLQQTLNTDGWKKIIEPLIDKMIYDVIGEKVNGRWEFRTQKLTADNLEYYKMGLIDLHTRIYQVLDIAKEINNKPKELNRDTLTDMQSSPYSEHPESVSLETGYEPVKEK